MRSWREWIGRRDVLRAGTALAVLAVLGATMLPTGGAMRRHVQAEPLHSIRSDFTWLPLDRAVTSVGGNIALFVPLGFFLLLAARRPLPWVVAVGAATSLAVETAQYVMGTRVSDVDDVVLNTAGTLLGAAAAVVLRALARRA